MHRLLSACVMALLAVSAYGFLASRMRLSEIDDKRDFRIVVSDVNADDSYAWVTVRGCTAEVSDAGVFCDPRGWEGRSDRAWSGKQTSVPFREAPRGILLRFDVVVSDRDGKMKASASMITTRGL